MHERLPGIYIKTRQTLIVIDYVYNITILVN